VRELLAARRTDGLESAVARARQTLLITQSIFFLALAVCLLINHGHVAANDGISYYGVYVPTMPILFTGYFAAAAGLWWTSTYFTAAGAPPFTRAAFRAIAIGLIVLLATPYNQGAFLNWTHMTVGVSMALLQLGSSILLLRRWRTVGSTLGFSTQLAGGVLGALSLPNWHFTWLLQSECLFELGFGWCLLEWTFALRSRRFGSAEGVHAAL